MTTNHAPSHDHAGEAIPGVPGHTHQELELYAPSTHLKTLAEEAGPAIVNAGPPMVHAEAIGTRAEVGVSMWVSSRSDRPTRARAREFERAAALALLQGDGEGTPAWSRLELRRGR